jgi:hypothetical protein
MSITVTQYTQKTHEMHSWQMELELIESNLIDAMKNVTTLQTFINQLNEKAASAKALLEDRTLSSSRKSKANAILGMCDTEQPKLTRQLEAAKSRLKNSQTGKENFNFPALHEEQRLQKLLRNLAS